MIQGFDKSLYIPGRPRRQQEGKVVYPSLKKKKLPGLRPGASPEPGEGTRFEELRDKLERQPAVRSPGALAAAIGRKKYKGRFAQLASAGRKRAAS
jgi:hypothetical protein